MADRIVADPIAWSAAVLGVEPAVYRERIIKETTWGGAIELAVLSEVYQIEIDSVDVETGRTYRKRSQRL